MNNYINKFSCWYTEQRNYLSELSVRSISVGSDISYFNEETEYTLIRQLLQELPDLGLLCLQKH